MASVRKRKIYFSSVQVRKQISLELEEDVSVIKTVIFDQIIHDYQIAVSNSDFSSFLIKQDDEILMISNLHYEDAGNVFCGIVSRGKPKIGRYIRECNPNTFSVKEIVPATGNVFEEYSFFAISLQKLRMAYLGDSAISNNIPALVLLLLRPSVNINYELEERCLLDTDVKKRIKSLGNKIIVKGTMIGQEQQIGRGLPSLSDLEKALGSKFSAVVKIRARVTKELTDNDIDTITNYATQREGFSSFTFADERDKDKEVVDVIKNQIRYSKSIELSDDEFMQPSIVWSKLADSFNIGG